jgi:superfamily II DNA helicase RecQ
MKCKTMRVRLAEAFAEGDEAEVNGFLETVEVGSMVASLVDFPEPRWSILLFFDDAGASGMDRAPVVRSRAERSPASRKTQEGDAEERGLRVVAGEGETGELSPEDELLLERLKSWRSERAKQESVPPYCVAHNRMLSLIAEKKPGNTEELMDMKGFGPARIEKYGEEIISIVASGAA